MIFRGKLFKINLRGAGEARVQKRTRKIGRKKVVSMNAVSKARAVNPWIWQSRLGESGVGELVLKRNRVTWVVVPILPPTPCVSEFRKGIYLLWSSFSLSVKWRILKEMFNKKRWDLSSVDGVSSLSFWLACSFHLAPFNTTFHTKNAELLKQAKR